MFVREPVLQAPPSLTPPSSSRKTGGPGEDGQAALEAPFHYTSKLTFMYRADCMHVLFCARVPTNLAPPATGAGGAGGCPGQDGQAALTAPSQYAF